MSGIAKTFGVRTSLWLGDFASNSEVRSTTVSFGVKYLEKELNIIGLMLLEHAVHTFTE